MTILQPLTFMLLYNFCMTLSIKLRLVEEQAPSANQIISSSHVICMNGTCKNESAYNHQSLITPNGVIQVKDTTDQNKESGKRGLAFHPSVIGVSTVVIMYIVFLLLYYLFYTRKNQKQPSPSSLRKPGLSKPSQHSESSDSDVLGDNNTEMIVINGEKVTTGRSGKNLWLKTDDAKQQRQMTCITKLDSSEPGRTQTCVRPKLQGGESKAGAKINLTMQPDRVQRAVISHQVSSSQSKHQKLQCPVIYIEDDFHTISDDNSIFSPMASSSTKDLFKSVTKSPLMDYLSLPLDGEEAAAMTLTPSRSVKRKLSYVKACYDSDDNSQSNSKCTTPYDDHIDGQFLAMDNNNTLCAPGVTNDNQLASVLTISRRLSYRNACDEEDDDDSEDVQSNNSELINNRTVPEPPVVDQSSNTFSDKTVLSDKMIPEYEDTLSMRVPQLVILPNPNSSININPCSSGCFQTPGNSSSLTLDTPDITISGTTLSPQNRVRKLSYYKACTMDEMTRYG